MRAASSAVAFRMMIGLSAAGLAAPLGCSGRPGSEAVVASAAASAAHAAQEREKGEEASCCARHFPGNRRLREACLSDAARHQGVCAPRCPPPRDAGGPPDAGRADGGTNDDGASSDGRPPNDASSDASVSSDASRIDAGLLADASDGGGQATCPTAIPIGAASTNIDNHSGWIIAATTSPGETVTWAATGTSGVTLLETSGPTVDLVCQSAGTATVTATVAGPGSCSFTETFNLPCQAACGNGVVEPGEQCDPPDGVTCNNQCQLGPNPTCGDGILEPGEDCDRVSSPFCKLCKFSSCYGCVASLLQDRVLGNVDLCTTVDSTQKIACLSLEECMFFEARGFCNLSNVGPTYQCFCQDASCSSGPTGPCGRALQAFIGTTDQAALAEAANSAAMTNLIAGMNRALSCHSFCALNP